MSTNQPNNSPEQDEHIEAPVNTTALTTKKNALLLTAFAAVCTLFVALTHLITKPVIEQQKQQNILNKLTEVLDSDKFDNNPLQNCSIVTNSSITGTDKSVTVYRATKQGQPYALIFQTETAKGYNGKIVMMAAIDQEGIVQGVRTLEHQETPGLGDKIELAKSDWVLSFAGREVQSIDDSKWYIKKDGGQFDQFTGATITPRAIVNQLRTSIYHSQMAFEQIFNAANDCQVVTPESDTLIDTNPNSEVVS